MKTHRESGRALLPGDCRESLLALVDETGGQSGMKGIEGLGYLRGRDTQVLHCCVVAVVGIRAVPVDPVAADREETGPRRERVLGLTHAAI